MRLLRVKSTLLSFVVDSAIQNLLLGYWSTAHLVEAHGVDVVEEVREQLDGEGRVDPAAAQQHHGRRERLQGRSGCFRGVRNVGATECR